MHPLLPDWLKWSRVDVETLNIFGSTDSSIVGEFSFPIFTEDTTGLRSEWVLNLRINSNLNALGNDTDPNELPTEWKQNWLGTFYTIDKSPWIYHTIWKWVYLQTISKESGAWFWKEKSNTTIWGWMWTDISNWDGANHAGYVYVANKTSWIFCRVDDDNGVIYYDYATETWMALEH